MQHFLDHSAVLLARPGPFSYGCRVAAGTSGSALLWLPCCCWCVRVHSLIVAVLLLARPGLLSYSCGAAAGVSGPTLLSLLGCCWHVRVHSVIAASLLLARPGPCCCCCVAAAGASASMLLLLLRGLLACPGPLWHGYNATSMSGSRSGCWSGSGSLSRR